MTGQNPVLEPLGKTITTKKKSLQDLKYLLEDRGVREKCALDRDSNNSYDNNCCSVVMLRQWCFSRCKTILFLCLMFVLVNCVNARSSGEFIPYII